ncbi:MAG TPA: hypothetical protein EYP36_06305 [Calditrichaeota bacterium]|nr:hypothetical protein [Calditrichota bacterium]
MRTNRTKLASLRKVSKMLTEKIRNWIDTNPRLSSGVVQEFNNKAKWTIKKAYGFKNEKFLQYALYIHLVS